MSRSGGWRITRASDAAADARVLDAAASGGAVAETLAALTAAEALRHASQEQGRLSSLRPEEALEAAADTVRYGTDAEAEAEAPLRRALGTADEAEAEVLCEGELMPRAACEILADERAALRHPPPAATEAAAHPADRVPPVRASALRCAVI
jgi:hypothetical protein